MDYIWEEREATYVTLISTTVDGLEQVVNQPFHRRDIDETPYYSYA